MRSFLDFQQWCNAAPEVVAREQLSSETAEPKGRCGLCRTETCFEGSAAGDIRERLACANCNAIARHRAAFAVLQDSCSDLAGARVYVTEQASGFYRSLRKRVGRLHGGEFGLGMLRRLHVQLWLLRKGVFERLRQRDVTALDFPDAALDAVVSLDVLEHVPDYRLALREVARVLRLGGHFVFTVPFYQHKPASTQVAWFNPDGTVGSIGEPEYHGDPVSGGVLCFHHFGWDLLAQMRQAGFREADVVRVHLPAEGVPSGLWVFRGRR